MFHESDIVRVRTLKQVYRFYEGDHVKKSPQVGDLGVVLYVVRDGQPRYIVESIDFDGYTVWLAEFDADELEPMAL